MAKGQKKLQEQATQRSEQQYETAAQAQKRLIDGSPEFAAYQARTGERRKTITDGTFADSKEFLSNRDSVAKRAAQREASVNMAGTGFGALGAKYASANQLAVTDKIMKDEFARDSAMQAEGDKRDFITQTQNQEADIVGKKIGVDTNLMGTGFSQSNQNLEQAQRLAASRASLIPGMIGMGLQAGSMFMGMGGMKMFSGGNAPGAGAMSGMGNGISGNVG